MDRYCNKCGEVFTTSSAVCEICTQHTISNSTNELQKQLTLHKEALRLACEEISESLAMCPMNCFDDFKCSKGLTCEYTSKEYEKCWQERFLNEARASNGN